VWVDQIVIASLNPNQVALLRWWITKPVTYK